MDPQGRGVVNTSTSPQCGEMSRDVARCGETGEMWRGGRRRRARVSVKWRRAGAPTIVGSRDDRPSETTSRKCMCIAEIAPAFVRDFALFVFVASTVPWVGRLSGIDSGMARWQDVARCGEMARDGARRRETWARSQMCLGLPYPRAQGSEVVVLGPYIIQGCMR